MISVIIPTLRWPGSLDEIREQLLKTAVDRELIIVAYGPLCRPLEKKLRAGERILFTTRRGRGFPLLQGAKEARGKFLLFLHDDTYLPPAGLRAIERVMVDPRISGGAFRLEFYDAPGLLAALTRLANWATALSHEFWGDHALFLRKEVLMRQPEVLQTPIMEDVRLSALMRKSGKTVLLAEKVRSSPEKFVRHGVFRQALRIVAYRLLFQLGWPAERIYKWYYPTARL